MGWREMSTAKRARRRFRLLRRRMGSLFSYNHPSMSPGLLRFPTEAVGLGARHMPPDAAPERGHP